MNEREVEKGGRTPSSRNLSGMDWEIIALRFG